MSQIPDRYLGMYCGRVIKCSIDRTKEIQGSKLGRYMGRNYSVDVLKLVFAIFIAMGHFGAELLSSTLIVDCFFVLSGYFIVRSFDSGKYKEGGSFAYVLARVKRIYPYYIVAFIILFIVKYFIQWNGISALKDAIKHSLPEFF